MMKKLFPVLLAVTVLAGCSGWLLGETPRVPSWRIVVDHSQLQPAQEVLPIRLVVNRPAVSPNLQTRSILVTRVDGSLSQAGDVQWADQPGRMLQRRLAERLTVSQRFADVSTDSFRSADETLLHIAVLRFDIEVTEYGLEAVGLWELRLPDRQLAADRIEVRQAVDGTGAEAMVRTLQKLGEAMVIQGADAVLAAFAD